MRESGKIDYLEFPTHDLAATKRFFSSVFGWRFTDYGPEYTAFSNAGMDGGFFHSDLEFNTAKGSALVVLYSADLEDTLARVEQAGGAMTKPIFAFPGGRRFHFTDPNGNEYAVWSELGV
ncbi:VOC family protein [Marinobacter caseinilyticus]|uniref:VOC family protein n=1 Tax=Marinobacter caseinilyticus TaxID=2692195 RepID=UPI00140C7879|nr:VOC family protein [Marinobacter caseinilyticus]